MLGNPKKWDRLAEDWAGESLAQKALLSTTQAIDVSFQVVSQAES